MRGRKVNKGSRKVHVCIDRIISEELSEILPRERIPSLPFPIYFRNDFAPRDLRLAVPVRKKWPNGYELTCCFLDGSSAQKRQVQKYAAVWEQHANVRFRFVSTKTAEICIAFDANAGSWSAVGTDALNTAFFSKSEATMNFGWLSDDTSDVECRRVVLHEFGHALGAIHEHQQPSSPLAWDKKVVYQVFSGPPNNWSQKEIENNIIHKYAAEQMNWIEFDPDSIMLYHFPPELFRSGTGTKLNTNLSTMDKKFISELYPRQT